MKKIFVILFAAAMISGLAVGSASAADNSLKQGTAGISVGVDNHTDFDVFVISGRYFFQHDLAAILEFGYRNQSGDVSGRFLGLGVGVRKYLKTADFAPFVEGRIKYETQDIAGDTDTLELAVNAGAEYFLHKQFSIEGSVGLALGKVENNAVANADYTYVTTHVVGVRANFYF
jgi:hypothetical protein